MLDKFIDNNSALIFVESALRSMAQTGNFEEKDVGEGLTVIMRTIISDYQMIKQFLQDHIQSKENAV